MVKGKARLPYVEDAYRMYTSIYKNIGIHIKRPEGLLKYDMWEVHFGSNGDLVGCFPFKRTKYGLKKGLSIHDGTSEGKASVYKSLESFRRRGFYLEVSHAMRKVTKRLNLPVICSQYAGIITGKHVEPVSSISYQRFLPNIGKVEKVLVGRPIGFKTTSWANPSCPVTAVAGIHAEPLSSLFGLTAHKSCLLFEE